MRSHFQRNVSTTAGFFFVRFIVSLIVALAYIIVAAAIQYLFVCILGETTFNYIVGGLLSLFLGAIVCERAGALMFMFVRGWHVAALAYVNKIRKSHAPAVTVGMKAFAKNIVGFGAVYGVRLIAKNLLADFKDKLWELLQDVPLVSNLKGFAENPIVQHMAGDVLNYGFDATIFYLIKNPPEDINEVPSTVVNGLKRYLYCLPSIMLTSISSYLLFRFLPKFLKWVTIFFVFMTQGVLPGILITVLMWPLFYILDNSLFSPLTMIMFISCFSKECDKEVDEESPTVQYVNSVLEGMDIGTSADDIDEEPEEEESKPRKRAEKAEEKVEEHPTAEEVPSSRAEEPILDVQPDMSEVRREAPSGPPTWMRNVQPPPMPGGMPGGPTPSPNWNVPDMPGSLSDIPFVDEIPPDPASSGSFGGQQESPTGGDSGGVSSLAALLKQFNARDLSQPAPGYEDSEDDGSPSVDDILSGGDF